MQQYYEVLVASAQYHGNEALTYSYTPVSDVELMRGAIVLVPLQRKAILGIVIGLVSRPQFATKDILEIFDLPALPAQLLELAQWVRDYYPAPLGMISQLIAPNSLSLKTIAEMKSLPGSLLAPASGQPKLTDEQQSAIAQMTDDDNEHLVADTYLLHGDTGTGKTRVYIELTQRAIAAGRSAIVLTPEIGLTSQLAASFRAVFGKRVVLIHSQLTPKARQLVWLQILTATQPLVVLGPRSALFAPIKDVGLVVVDEFHEPAYKQEQAPHYHAVRVASQLARMHGAALVLGSATPPIIDYYMAEQKAKKIIRMRQQAASTLFSDVPGTETAPNPVTTHIVDLKDRDAFGRSQYLSKAMLQAIDHSLQHGQQILLYLNRRGTARVILCNACGWQAVCPHCDLPLTYHHDLHILQCHTCGYKQPTPTSCPECGNTDVVFKVVGTKAIEEEVRRMYPNARIMRFDTDNTTAERFDKHYEAVKAGEIDILVGTQLLAKGLDLPRLSTLGVVIADTSLTFPDYSAEERTYQLLAQVIGRVGRGHRDNMGQPIEQRIVVQSYAPDRPVIDAALAREWDLFYQNELEERKLFDFPPFCYLLKLTCRRATSASAEKASEQFMYSVKELGLPLLIEGPMPSFHGRVGDKYEWQLIIKSRQRPALLRVLETLKTDAKSGWSYDIDPVNLL